LYLPNAEMTLDLEANDSEVEVKVLTSLASVTEITGRGSARLASVTGPTASVQVRWVNKLLQWLRWRAIV
jgi:hypothetical protein